MIDVQSERPPVGTRLMCFFGANKYRGTVVKYGRKWPVVRFTLGNGKVKEGRATILPHGAPTGVTYVGYLAQLLPPESMLPAAAPATAPATARPAPMPCSACAARSGCRSRANRSPIWPGALTAAARTTRTRAQKTGRISSVANVRNCSMDDADMVARLVAELARVRDRLRYLAGGADDLATAEDLLDLAASITIPEGG